MRPLARPVITRITSVAVPIAALILLFGVSGCNSQSRAKGAQSPPPPTLSSPVRVEQKVARSTRPTVRGETVPTDEYAFLKNRQVGSRKTLPQVGAPVYRTRPAVQAPPVRRITSRPAPATTSNGTQRVATSSPAYHIMAKGDTLYAVARKYHLPPKQLIAANNFKNPNRLPVGTRVVLPNKD